MVKKCCFIIMQALVGLTLIPRKSIGVIKVRQENNSFEAALRRRKSLVTSPTSTDRRALNDSYAEPQTNNPSVCWNLLPVPLAHLEIRTVSAETVSLFAGAIMQWYGTRLLLQ